MSADDIEQGEDPGIVPTGPTCRPCFKDQHEDCQVCGCWCREVARQEEEEAAPADDDTVTLTRPLCVGGELSLTESETRTVHRDQGVGL